MNNIKNNTGFFNKISNIFANINIDAQSQYNKIAAEYKQYKTKYKQNNSNTDKEPY